MLQELPEATEWFSSRCSRYSSISSMEEKWRFGLSPLSIRHLIFGQVASRYISPMLSALLIRQHMSSLCWFSSSIISLTVSMYQKIVRTRPPPAARLKGKAAAGTENLKTKHSITIMSKLCPFNRSANLLFLYYFTKYFNSFIFFSETKIYHCPGPYPPPAASPTLRQAHPASNGRSNIRYPVRASAPRFPTGTPRRTLSPTSSCV